MTRLMVSETAPSVGAASGSIDSRGETTGVRLATTIVVQVPDDPSTVRVAEPVTLGLPFPAGFCTDETHLGVSNAAGSLPLQTRVLERWPDGSIRWALLDFQANAPASYDVRVAATATAVPVDGLVVREEDGAAEVESAGLVFRVYPKGQFRLDVRGRHGRTAVRRVNIDLTRRDGTLLHPDVSSVAWESTGTLRSVLCVSASIGSDISSGLQLLVRLHFYAGSPTIRFEVTVLNPARAAHPDGIWELGDPGSVLIRDCSVRIETGAPSDVRCSVDCDHALETLPLPFELYQDSSGGEHWQSSVHVNRDGVIPVSFRGYRLKAAAETREGLRATPVVWTDDGFARTGVAIRQFWQNSPKSLESDGRQIVLRLFPKQFGDLHEIQGGERKTHAFHVAFADDQVSAMPLDWARRPAQASAAPAWYCGAGAVPYLTPASDDPNTDYVALVNSIIDGPERFEARREAIDEFGWRNFGDIYADHEAVFHAGPVPMVSHYNNQYDAVAGFAYHFLRSADPRWWAAMDELAWHVRDIDIYHTTEDKAAYSGGLLWHTVHYVDAGRSSHRSYPKADGVSGGGPANEHCYSTGLMMHYFLTGEPASREAAIGLADWALRIDDGRRTPFRWVSRGDTGLASKTHTMEFHGPGRGAGNVIVVLLNAYRLTARAEFLAKAEALVRRCIHPNDHIDDQGLLDPESRWSYTVFLQALGRFLDEKILRQEFDASYAHAQASLRHYARWMIEHESLYLDKPEILEYPTETWAAQDMRKSDVFQFAARHTDGAERDRFLARAEYFFREAMRMLGERPTRFTARPRVLLMICGFMRAAFQINADGGRAPEAAPLPAFGARPVFLPQKAAVKRRLKRLSLAGLVGVVALTTWLIVAIR